MIKGIGVDIADVARVKRASQRNGFLERVFTEAECEYFITRRLSPESIAGTFAAKEAVAKALGTGFAGFSTRDIEILHGESGCPSVILHGGAKERLFALGALTVLLSISHEKAYAVAFACVE